MRGSTATRQAPSARALPVEIPESLEETAFGRRYVDPEPAKRYDLLVVGVGEVGIAAACEAARLGARVALVGRELPGPGNPTSRRVPAEALLRSARALGDARLAAELGLQGLESAWFDYAGAVARARNAGRLLAERHHPKRLREQGIDLFVGEARFTAPTTMTLGRRTLFFDKACLTAEEVWTYPAAPGLEEVGFQTPDTLDAWSELPARLAVVGAGPEGCELAQAFARFGARVTLIEAGERILPCQDADAAALVRRALAEDGVRVLEGFRFSGAETVPGARRLLLAEAEGGALRPLDVDEILFATGRATDFQAQALERAGVETDASGIPADERLRTSNPRIFVAGTLASGVEPVPGVAHAHLVVQNALCLGRRSVAGLLAPRCVLTDPEVVHVGLHRRQAEQQGLAVETFRADFTALERAVLDGEDQGFLKLITTKKEGRILGATLVARHASESLDALTLALQEGFTLDRLAALPRPRPSQSAAAARAAEPFVPRHVPLRVARWTESLLRFLRLAR